MITWQQFLEIVRDPNLRINRPIDRDPQGQERGVRSAEDECLFIVAGPGSGKTTVLALRTLKLVFVDEIEPNAIMATTFTKKAAKELRSRILSWGDMIRQEALNIVGETQRQQLQRLDLNAIVTGTLDSIAEQQLAEHRAPGTQPPVVIETFVSQTLMLLEGLFPTGLTTSSTGQGRWDRNLRDYITRLRGSSFGMNATQYARITRDIRDKFLYDFVNVQHYLSSLNSNCPICGNHPHPGVPIICNAIDYYVNSLQTRGVVDFAGLEQHFLVELQSGGLQSLTDRLRVILVDEYQDTNLLQEQIYFVLASNAINNGGGITVVGDDDQSLFRFRGATVDLFNNFTQRINQQLGISVSTIFLSNNYRSTDNVVDFVNNFSQLDTEYQVARVSKPQIIRARNVNHNPPILGMFRDDVETLSEHLAQFIHQIFHMGGYRLQNGTLIEADPNGSVGDCALLMHSPGEVREYFQQNQVRRRERLPLLLRRQLQNMQPQIPVFNPRGQQLAEIPPVMRLCGLLLECIDPQGRVQSSIRSLPQEAIHRMNLWRNEAQRYLHQYPQSQQQGLGVARQANTLPQFVDAWRRRVPQGNNPWPDQIFLADLAYKLVTWIPEMQDDIEGLVFLEVIIRTITESIRFNRFESRIVYGMWEEASVQGAIRDIFVPIAMGLIEVDEDLLETLPRDRVNVLSIHQAKGLEFPLTIVDVGSDFTGNYSAQARFRYPRSGDLTHNLEDELRQFSQHINTPTRSALDRSFDDLIRLYFVAFSRPQDVLLLVGLNTVRTRNNIQNIATGWNRNGIWQWGRGLPNLVHI